MITELQQEQAALCALGLLSEQEQQQFAGELRANPELRELLRSLQRVADRMALAGTALTPPPGLKAKVLSRIQNPRAAPALSDARQSFASAAGLRFLAGSETSGWKQ